MAPEKAPQRSSEANGAASPASFREARHLSALLTLTARLTQELISTDLAPLGITYAQAIAMIRLWRADSGALHQSDLTVDLSLSRPSTALVLRSLEQRELIRRSADTADGRRQVVKLTSRGKALEGPVLEAFARAEERLSCQLDNAERTMAFDTLLRVLEAIRPVPSAT